MHAHIAYFINRLIAAVMIVGHPAIDALLWVNIRGGEEMPTSINLFLLVGEILVMVWVLLVLSVSTSGITKLPIILIRKWKAMTVHKRIVGRRVASLKIIGFKTGNWFAVNRDSLVHFINTLLDNLTNAVLTFQ